MSAKAALAATMPSCKQARTPAIVTTSLPTVIGLAVRRFAVVCLPPPPSILRCAFGVVGRVDGAVVVVDAAAMVGGASQKRGLFVVDDGQNRRDARALHQTQALIGAGRFDEAAAVVGPLAADPTTSIRAQGALLLAALHAMHGRAADVVALVDAVAAAVDRAALTVDHGFLLMLRAQALRQLRRTDEAVRDALAACGKGDTPGRLLVLADCLGAAGDVAGAVAALRRARALDDKHVAVLGQLAGWLARAGDRVGSDVVYGEFAGVKGVDADDDRNDAFACACRGDVDGATRALEAALEKDAVVTAAYVDDEDAFAGFRHTLSCVRAATAG